jgi:hypothetical protein
MMDPRVAKSAPRNVFRRDRPAGAVVFIAIVCATRMNIRLLFICCQSSIRLSVSVYKLKTIIYQLPVNPLALSPLWYTISPYEAIRPYKN